MRALLSGSPIVGSSSLTALLVQILHVFVNQGLTRYR
jgi:hypothetical protein